MKLRHLNFIELHIEKLILALGVIFFLIVIWRYALNDPYAVSIGQEEGIGSGQIETKILHEQSRLNAKIELGAPSPLPPMSVPAYTVMFRKRLGRSPLPIAQLDPLGELGLTFEDESGNGDSVPPDVPMPPPPVRMAVRAGFGVLADDHQLANYYATVSADAAGWSSPSGQEVVTAYQQWVGNQQPRDFRYVSVSGFFDAAAWRRMRPPNGSISPDQWEAAMALTDVVLERQTFNPVQGQWQPAAVVDPLAGALSFRDPPNRWTTSQAQQAIKLIKARQDEIARSPFVPMTADAVAWQPPEVADRQVSDDEAGSGGQEESVSESDGWKIWAHDLTVQPGTTYRYRLRVSLINPLFQKSRLQDERYEKYFHTLAVRSQVNGWTEPLTIEPLRRFFVVGGSGVERRATIEVWRVFNGRYRVAEFRVNPGDRLGQIASMTVGDLATEVDMGMGGLVVDLVDAASERGVGGRSALLYMTSDTDRLLERSIEVDRASPIRARLIRDTSVIAEAGPAVTGIR